MKALLSDEKKCRGVESFILHGIGTVTLLSQDPEVTMPEPYNTEIKKKRSEWIRLQPTFNTLVSTLLSGKLNFTRLESLWFDANAVLNEGDAVLFFSFVRRHPGIRNVVVSGSNTGASNKLTFTHIPCKLVCCLANLECAIIYGPVLPLLLGFSFSSDGKSREFGGLVRHPSAPDTLPLKQIKLWWSQRVVRIVQIDDRDGVDLDLLDVMKALSSVCKSTLEILSIGVDDDLDRELIDVIYNDFPNLRELKLGPARSDVMSRLPNHDFLRLMAEKLGKLKCLERFVYSHVYQDSEEAIQHADVLKTNEQWEETLRHFADHCPTLNYIKLYSLMWRKVTPRNEVRK
ncbi:hypothetical protein AX15_002829 [Amanita polypyramis BW_CC]|nr:hypothetical protein AX15_002829 [Amanita polypyramis BW_CC]